MKQQAGVRVVLAETLKEKALTLRITGKTYREISDELDISISTAHAYITDSLDALKEKSTDLAQRVREMDLLRLDAMLASLWDKRADPRTADTLIRILDRRAKLTGADMPFRWEGSGGSGLIPNQNELNLRNLSLDQLRQLETIIQTAASGSIQVYDGPAPVAAEEQ